MVLHSDSLSHSKSLCVIVCSLLHDTHIILHLTTRGFKLPCYESLKGCLRRYLCHNHNNNDFSSNHIRCGRLFTRAVVLICCSGDSVIVSGIQDDTSMGQEGLSVTSRKDNPIDGASKADKLGMQN
jgi:hypothetical protein